MGKPPKKKGGKKDAPKEEPSPSTETFEAPSTSEPPEAAEAEDDSGLTGAARKKKEKKEKKEKALQALQALQASRKPSTHSESTSRAESEVPPEQPSTAQSKGPSESSVEAQPPSEGPADVPLKKPEEPAHPKTEQKTEEEGDIGLGLTGTRKKKPRKKKADAPPTAGQGPSPQEVQPVTSELAAMSISSQQVPLPEPKKAISPPPTEEKTSIQKAQDHPKRIECRYIIPSKIPGGKVRATAIKVLVNYLEMEFKSLQISRYDVTFAPDKPKKMLPEVFAKVKAKFFPKDLIAFDQMKNCYSLRPLKKVPDIDRFVTVVEVIDKNGKTMNFQVSLKATGVVDLENIRRYMVNRATSLCHPTEEVQCIDVILRQGALESYIKAGRQFFKRPLNPIDLGYGYEMWTGMFQSAIFTNKSFINVDVAHKGFPKHQKLIDALVKDFNLDPSKPLETQRGSEYFASFVKGLKVVAMMVGDTPSAGQRREYVCNALTSGSDVLTFNMTLADKKEQKISVLNYFQHHKKYRLKYPTLNCLWVGNRDRSIFFPIELLEVAEGQAINRQLNEFQVSKMVREAATPPNERMKKITEVISDMKYSQNKDFKKFGLEISDKFYTVNAKVLEPPVLEIGTGKVRPRNGQWQANRLLKPEPLQSWGLIAVDTDSRNDYNSMIDILISTGTAMGMNVAKPKMVVVSAKMNMLHKLLMQAYEDVRLMFIIVSARGRDDYHRVKQLAEREVGILTQCVKEMTARRMNTMTAKNILLKVNSKLMGINQAIDTITMPRCLKEGGVMIVGADVTHPSPDQSNVPSIAAVTASMDAKCFIYNIELSIQTPKKEVIVEFGDMMCDHLKLYLDRNRVLPRKIFVFRDGVSEGQFAQVMNSELAAVHDAYARFAGPNKKPEVLFLLVQKRHHTRLFNQGGNMHYNVEPGTVVDTDIVHASELDFYLVSHQAIKGTARPTRYHAVCNDGKIPDDEVEQLTFYLCHLYSRCMRSVSYPTPTYYAHLACMRARSLTHGETFDNKALEKKPKRLRVLDKMLQFSRMFFV